jgi:hypothetical protein
LDEIIISYDKKEIAIKNKLYHGTGRDIQKFDKSKLRRTAFGEGFHLAESPNLANFYANQFDEGQNVMPVYAAIKNPYELKSMHGTPMLKAGIILTAEVDKAKVLEHILHKKNYYPKASWKNGTWLCIY